VLEGTEENHGNSR